MNWQLLWLNMYLCIRKQLTYRKQIQDLTYVTSNHHTSSPSCIVCSFRVSCVFRIARVKRSFVFRSLRLRFSFVCVFRSFAFGAYCKLIRSRICMSCGPSDVVFSWNVKHSQQIDHTIAVTSRLLGSYLMCVLQILKKRWHSVDYADKLYCSLGHHSSNSQHWHSLFEIYIACN